MKKTLLSTLVLTLLSVVMFAAGNESVYVQKVDFESGTLPEGWTQEFVNSDLYGEHPWAIEKVAESDYPKPNAKDNGEYILALRNTSPATIGYTTRLISPVMDLSMNKVFQPILVFSHAQQQRTGDFDQLKVFYRSKATDNWVRLDGRNGNPEFNQKITKWQNDTIQLTSQSDTYQVMFEVTDNFGRGVVLDNIGIRPMPTCEDPYGYSVSGLTANSAVISWNASFDTDSFEVVLTTAPVEEIENVDPASVVYFGFLTDDEFSLSTSKLGLTLKRNQMYYLYVRSYCQNTTSEWTSTSFRTKNVANLPLVQNLTAGEEFEYKSSTLNHISYWSYGTSIKRDDGVTMEYMPFVNTNTQPGTASAGYYAFDQSFCLAFTGARSLSTDIPAGQYVYAATPELNVTSLKDVFVSFWGTAYQSVGDAYASGIIVGVMTDPEDFTTFVPVDTCYNTTSRTFNKFGVSLASYEGEGKYVAFASDFRDKANRFYIDNILIKASSTPVWPSDIKVTNVTAEGFDVSLNSMGYAYNLLVAKHVSDINGLIVIDPSNFSGDTIVALLENQTAQKVHVNIDTKVGGQLLEIFAQNINAAGAGEWSLPVTTRPPMFLSQDKLPFKIDWEETDTWSERQLHPFGSEGVNYNYPTSIITSSQYAPNYYGLNSSYLSLSSGTESQEGVSSKHYVWMKLQGNRVTKGDPDLYTFKHKYGDYFAVPQVADLKKVLLKFYMKRYSSTAEGSARVAVGVMSDPYDMSTFETVATFDANSMNYEPFSCSFDSYQGTGKIIAIQAIESDNPYESGSTSSSDYGWVSVYYSNLRLDWVQLFPLGECNPIANPVVEAAHDSAIISWGANGMTKWRLRLKNSKDVMLVDSMIEQTSFVAKGLMPHSEYTYMVSPECDAEFEVSDWLKFKTECLPGEPLPFVEDFESDTYITGSSNKFIPFCWTSPIYTYTYESSTSYYPYIYRSTSTAGHNSNSSLAMYTNTSSTVQDQMWVALPLMSDDINKLQVEFFVKGYSTTQNSMFQVGVMTDPSDVKTFEVVDSVNVIGTTWRGALTKFDKYTGQGKYIAFKRNFERDGKTSHYYLDDITVSYISDCEKLFDLKTTDATTNGATFTWKNTGADQYEVLVLKENLNPNSADTTGKVISVLKTDQTSLVYRNDDLELNTIYYAFVRTICGVVTTTWSEAASFRTTCLPQTPADFGVETFGQPTVMGCWSTGVMSGTTAAPTRNGSNTSKFGWYMRIFNTAASDGAYAIMPPLDVDDISKYQITFDACTNSTTAGNVKSITVGIISNASDLSTFAPITTITGLNYTTDSLGMFTYTVPFDTYDGDFVTGAKGNQVMFLSESGDNYNEAYIDNISFSLIGACNAPSKVYADSIGTYGAKIAWNPTGAAYELAITETKTAPDKAGAKIVSEVKNLTDTVATVEGLQMLTQYYMFVRTICGVGDTSAWSNARAFTTICPEAYPLPYAEDFEKCASGTKKHPSCWVSYTDSKGTITENDEASYPYTTTGGNNSSSRALYMYSSAATSYVLSYTAMPQLEVDLKKVMLSFWYKANAAGSSTAPDRRMIVGIADEVATLDTLLATFQPIDTVITTVTTYAKYSRVISEKYNGEGKYIVFIGYGGNGATSSGGVYIDDIEISLVPTCFKPDNLSAEKMYDTSAELSWEQLQGDNKAWDVAYGLAETPLESMTIVPADTNVFVINGLQPSTEYDFYVRANCGGGDVSEWRGPVSATTLYQISLAEAKWTFENGEVQVAQAPTGSNKKPQTWFVNNVWTGLATVGNAPYITYNSKNATTGLITANKAYSGDSVMYFYSNTTAHPGYGPYAALPVIKDEDYNNLQIRFMARVTYSNTTSKVDGRDSMMYTTYSYAGGSYKRTIYVGVATDPYDMSTFEELTQYVLPTLGTSTSNVDINKVPDPEGTNYWREVVVPLYGAKGKYIILAGPGDYNTVFVDDVIVEKVDPNACANVTKLALNEETLKYNSAEFTWLSPKSNFKVTITEKDSNQEYATATVNTSSFSINTLQPQTAYTISVQAICLEDATSKAVTLDFTTPCKPASFDEAKWGFTDNLYQWGTSATYVMPECWDVGLANGSGASYTPYAIINANPAAASKSYSRGDTVGGRALCFYTTKANYNAYAVMPEVDFPLDSMTLHFWGRAAQFNSSRATTQSNKNKLGNVNSNYARTLLIGVMTDPSDFSTFVPLDRITYDFSWTSVNNVYANADNDFYWQEYALPLAKYQGKGRITIVAPNPADYSTASTPTSYFYVDDVEIVKGDFCTLVTGHAASNVTATSATVTWSELVGQTKVHLQVATNDEFAESSLVYNEKVENTNTVDLTDLKPSSTYYIRLKHICDEEAGDESEWNNPVSFLTDYVVRFSENFDRVNRTMPINWSRSTSASAANVFDGSSTLSEASETATYAWRVNTASNQQIYCNLTTNNASSSSTTTYTQYNWLITPEIDLSANAEDSLLLSFDIALRSAGGIPNPNTGLFEQFMVIVSPDQGKTWKQENATIWSTDDSGDFDFNSFYSNGEFLTKYIDLSKYAGQTVKIAFYAGSAASGGLAGSKNYIYLDNIQFNTYKLIENSDKICRWEDYSGYQFDIDADMLPAGSNFFERFTPAKSNASSDVIERLTIEVEDESVTELQGVVLCEGDTYNDNNFSFIATKSATYKQKLQSAIGCDSTVILPVKVNMKKYVDTVATICWGSYYEFGGEKYYTSTNKTETFVSAEGCDSIVTLHLTVKDILRGEAQEVFLCPGTTYAFTDKYPALSEDGEYVDTIVTAQGCDTIAAVRIINVPEGASLIRAAICQGEVYDEGLFGGLRNAGDYSTPHGDQGLKTVYGCDSIVTLHLMVATPNAETQTFELYDTISSDKLPYVLNGVELLPVGTERGVYTRTVSLGCGEATLVINVDNAEGVDDIYVNTLAVTPNPVSVGEAVRVLGQFSNAEVEVITATGAVAYRQQFTTGQITVPGIPVAGVYLVRLTDSKGVYHAKLVVK